MTRYVGAAEAARQLGVRRETLYAYVSRGLIGRRVAVDGRTSLYSVDDLEALGERARRREPTLRPSLDVQISTGITTLDEEGVRYRGRDVAELARTSTFEDVAELLWTGELGHGTRWLQPTGDDVRIARRALAGATNGVPALIAMTNALGAHQKSDDAPAAARRLLSVIPAALTPAGRDPPGQSTARRLAAVWLPDGGPREARVTARAIERALILLADHELATSTLGARLAASVRTNPYAAIVAGLAVITGLYHGGSSAAALALLQDCGESGVEAAIEERLQSGERLAGFGHKVYAGLDPRLAPLLEAVNELPGRSRRKAIVREVVAAAGVRLVQRPNVDLGLGALLYVAGLPASTPIFAVARIAGFAAHIAEELGERPVRYRGLARTPAPR